MEQFTQLLFKYIDPVYLIVFMSLASWLKGLVQAFLVQLTNKKIDRHIPVFLIGSIAAIPFILWAHDPLRLLVTYTLGTSIYDLILKASFDRIKKFFGPNE